MHRKLHADQREQAGDDIIQHDAKTAADAAIQPGNRPRLENIKQTKQHKTNHNPHPSGRRGDHGDEITGDFIKHNAGVVVHPQLFRRQSAYQDANQADRNRGGDKNIQAQHLYRIHKRYRHHGAGGARRNRRASCAKTAGEQHHRIFQLLKTNYFSHTSIFLLPHAVWLPAPCDRRKGQRRMRDPVSYRIRYRF